MRFQSAAMNRSIMRIGYELLRSSGGGAIEFFGKGLKAAKAKVSFGPNRLLTGSPWRLNQRQNRGRSCIAGPECGRTAVCRKDHPGRFL